VGQGDPPSATGSSPRTELSWEPEPEYCALEQLQPSSVREVSREPGQRPLLESALRSFHYLDHRGTWGRVWDTASKIGWAGLWLSCSLVRRLGSSRIGTSSSVGLLSNENATSAWLPTIRFNLVIHRRVCRVSWHSPCHCPLSLLRSRREMGRREAQSVQAEDVVSALAREGCLHGTG
jgi:hypothetical protein